MKLFRNPFRRITVEEANVKVAEYSAVAYQHHKLEALRLRYEAAERMAQAAAHEVQANSYSKLAEEHGGNSAALQTS